MTNSRRSAAARNALAAVMTMAMLPARAFAADGEPQLVLPLVAAVALGASVVTGASHSPPHAEHSIIPDHMHIPDLYAVDVERDPLKFSEPIDRDRMFSIDLLPRARRGWMPSFIYDDESGQVMKRGSTIMRVSFEYTF